MTEIMFFLPMQLPTVTHQQHKVTVVNGKPRFYEPAELKAAREKFTAALAPYAPKAPMNGAVQLVTKWLFPITGTHENGEFKTTKPDTDNLIKLVKDVMTRLGFWHDDAQVASEITEKFYADKQGLFVIIKEVGPFG